MAYLGETIKKLGFGMMRLPQKDGKIDIEQTKKMVDLFMAAGFTYFDTAWAYNGSEDAVRQALVERYPRESYQLATKNAAWINCKTKEEAQKVNPWKMESFWRHQQIIASDLLYFLLKIFSICFSRYYIPFTCIIFSQMPGIWKVKHQISS